MENKLEIILNILALMLVELIGISLIIEVFSKEGLYIAKIALVFAFPGLIIGAKTMYSYAYGLWKKTKK